MRRMIRACINALKKVLELYRRIKRIPEAKAIADLPCYYPDKPRKDRRTRVKDNIAWLLKYGEVNNFYTLYGLDLVGSADAASFMDYRHFMHERNAKNQMGDVMSQLVLLRDKYMFYKYMTAAGLPVAEVFAVIKNGKVYDQNLNYVGESFLQDRKDYFVKVANGECANFVKHIEDFDEYLSIKEQVRNGDYIIQKRIVQSPAMNRLNDKAINTMRIITVYNNGEPYVFSAVLRIGTSATGNVDNWARGGIVVNIGSDGFLERLGLFKPQYGLTTQYHPDSNIKLSEFQVPMYKDALALACEAHRHFYGIESIGWDVAVSDRGLVFIEGNDNWEISLHQAVEGPLRKKWESLLG